MVAWEAEAEQEEMLTAREAAARKAATATPDGQAADGQNKIFGPGGCVPLAVAVELQRRSRWSLRSCKRCSLRCSWRDRRLLRQSSGGGGGGAAECVWRAG